MEFYNNGITIRKMVHSNMENSKFLLNIMSDNKTLVGNEEDSIYIFKLHWFTNFLRLYTLK